MSTSLLLPDTNAVFVAYLGAQFPAAAVATKIPADLAGVVPFIQVVRFGGASRTTVDDPSFDVYWFDVDEVLATAGARQVQRQLLFLARGAVVTYGTEKALICDVRCSSGPTTIAYGNSNVERVGATYTAALQVAH